jgi:hypothetical protein
MIIGATLLDIRDAMKEWSKRRNVSDATLNDMINIASTRASRELRIPPMEREVTPTVDSQGYFDIPSDFIEAKELVAVRNSKNIILERKAIHEIDAVNNNSGAPCFFARTTSKFRVAPYDSPDPDGSIYMYYYAVFGALVNDGDCNWLSSNAGDLLLYGALGELAAYTRDDEGEQRWLGKFMGEINRLQAIEDRAAWSGSTMQISVLGSS